MKMHHLVRSAAMAAVLLSATAAMADMPKYVFFFVGDGMSSAQIQATEAYLTTKNGGSAKEAEDLLKPENRLNMSKLPVLGMQTTYDAHALMTDSASAGTAFACGVKTASGVIGMDDSKTVSYKSIAQLAKEQGKRVGVVSSVSLDHATPASFYASVPSRSDMNTIASQMAETGYDFFGGGGLVKPEGNVNVWDKLTQNGYTVLNSRDAILDLKKNPKSRVVAINPTLDGSKAMPYAIDRDETTDLSLAEMTEVAIASLLTGKKDGKKRGWGNKDDGFFLMVEGGKIDWACHANDAVATIGDTLDFDDAVGVALSFYHKYPFQTLIVVTGDHETGGMTVGHATTGYTAYYNRLLGQKSSYDAFGKKWAEHKAGTGDFEDMKVLMAEDFGLVWNDLNAYQQEKLNDAYELSRHGTNGNSMAKNIFHYGGYEDAGVLKGNYEPIIVTITHILNERASIGWTSYSHTGVPVPVFAIGPGSKRFAGFYDNTDIAKQISRAMGIWQQLPIVK